MGLATRIGYRAAGTALLAVAGFWIYGPALRGGWIWDDEAEIHHSELLKSGSGWWQAWVRPEGPDYFPLKTELQWCEWHLWGDRPAGYHWVNLDFHILAACFLWRVLARLAGEAAGFMGGLLFLVHPLAVESVAWISELKNVMSLTLFLVAFDSWMDWATSTTSEGRAGPPAPPGDTAGRAGPPYLKALAWFTAAMLCKSSVVMFPAVLLLYAWWRRGRVGKEEVKASLPFFGVSLLLGLVTLWFQTHRAIAGLDLHLGGWLWRLGSAAMAVVFYFFKSVAPVGLMPIYPDWGEKVIWLQPIVCGCLILAGLAVLLGRAGRPAPPGDTAGRAGLFGIGFFLINLLPVLGFLPMSYLRISRVADHLAYLPLVGVVSLAAVLLSRTPRRLAVGAVLALLLAAASREQAKTFRSSLDFWTSAARSNPDSWLAQNSAGADELAEGRVAAAAANFEAALRARPDYDVGENNLGEAMMEEGKLPEAVAHFERALRLNPDLAEAELNLGLACARLGRLPEAIGHYREAIRRRPGMLAAHNDLGNALLRSGRITEAIFEYETALRFDPNYREARNNLAEARKRLKTP